MNKCSPCGLDFTSVAWFDAHRVGKHVYTYSEGLKIDPLRDDGRRCLSKAELLERGWSPNSRGQWRGIVKEFRPWTQTS